MAAARYYWDDSAQRFTEEKPARSRAPSLPGRMPPITGPFMPVTLSALVEHQLDALLPPVVRLYCYLACRSRRGFDPVELKGSMLREISIDPSRKSRHLRTLVKLGLAAVSRPSSHANPVVTLTPQPWLANTPNLANQHAISG